MVLPHPKRTRLGDSSQSPLFEPFEPSETASAMTIKEAGLIDLTEVLNHPTQQMAHSKIGVVCDKPDAAYIELRSRYREIFLRTAKKFNPKRNHAEKVAFEDVAALVNTEGIDNPQNLIYRHGLGWSTLMHSGEEIFTAEWNDVEKHPKILGRPEQESVWYKGICAPAEHRLHEYLRDLELLNNIILDVEEISK